MKVLKRYASFQIAGLILAIFAATFSPGIRAQENSMVGPEASSDEQSRQGAKVEEEAPPDDAAPPATNGVIAEATYPFTALSGVALEDMTSGTTQLLGPALDDTASPVTNIGFDFFFDGVRHSQFSCNANGLCRLGSVVVTTTFINSLATVTAAPKITPYWDDLCTGSNGKVHFKTTGAPGSRKLIVEWQNMKVPRDLGCGDAGTGTFQLWLFESTGVIQFVYGALPISIADSGYSVGLQSGVATNFASVSAAAATVSYAAANNTQTDAITATTSFVFTPNVPAAPSALTFAPVTATSLQLNWTDNATNEAGYIVHRSLDGTNYSFLATLPANAGTFTDTFLIPSTTYFYRVIAFSEGALSAALDGSQATATPGTVTSTVAGGLWSSPATWAGGVVPTASDNVTIADGATVTIDTAATALSVKVGSAGGLNFAGEESIEKEKAGAPANLVFDSAAPQTLTVGLNVTINSGTSFRSAATGTVTTHNLIVGGSITNNGELDFSTNGDTAGANITFVSPNSATFGGIGPTTDVRGITVNKGTSSATTLELNPTNFTITGLSTDPSLTGPGGFLTLTAGTFKISGTFTASFRTFAGAAAYSIPATAGFWLNNPNYSVTGQNASPTNNGLLRITQGTFDVGTSSGNSMGGGTGAEFFIEGGTLNTAGRLQTISAVNYTQTGGVVNVNTVGNAATTASFGLTSTLTNFNMSGGVINLVQINSTATATSRRDYQMGGVAIITGGTLNVGTAATTGNAGNFEFRITGRGPNVVIDNTTNPKALSLAGTTFIHGNLTIPAGSAVNLHNGVTAQTLQFLGNSITNNGEINGGVAAASRLNFLGTDGAGGGTQSYGGSGTWGTNVTPTSGFGILGMVNINSPIITNRVNLFGGLLINSGSVTLGNGGASATVVQVSQAGSLINGGTFDVAPVFNTGTGGHTLLYLIQPSPRTTGFEVPPSRTILAMTVDEPNNLTIAGGDLTLTGTMTLTNGTVFTGTNVITHNGTAARTNGFINGNLSRSYSAVGTYTYHVGQNGYSPAAVTLTALGTTPSSLTVSPTDDFLPGLQQSTAVSRFWSLTEVGDMTATLNFTYLDADINGTETNYKIFRRTGGVTAEVAGSTINAATNTATVTGITDFSDWGIGEALDTPILTADIGGRLELSGGRGISNATIILTNPGGEVHRTQPNQFGYYRFLDVPTGVSYTVTVDSKRYSYNPSSQTFTLTADNFGVNFTGTVILPLTGQETQKSIGKP